MKELKASKKFAIRFSEVDSMNVVWHGSYPLYFEDAREAFGEKYGLEYMASLLTAIMHHWLTFPFIIRSQSNMG